MRFQVLDGIRRIGMGSAGGRSQNQGIVSPRLHVGEKSPARLEAFLTFSVNLGLGCVSGPGESLWTLRSRPTHSGSKNRAEQYCNRPWFSTGRDLPLYRVDQEKVASIKTVKTIARPSALPSAAAIFDAPTGASCACGKAPPTRPAEAMFGLLPTGEWGNGIPNYSLDTTDVRWYSDAEGIR